MGEGEAVTVEKVFRLSDPVRRIVSSYQAALAVLSDAGEDIGAENRLEAEATPAGLSWATFKGARRVAGGLAPWDEVAVSYGAAHAAPLDEDTVAVWDSFGKEGRQDAQQGASRPLRAH